MNARSAVKLIGDSSTASVTTVTFSPDASWVAGDVVLLTLTWASNAVLTADAAFTHATNSPKASGTGATTALLTHTLTSGDVSSPPTWTFTLAAGSRFVGVAAAIPNTTGIVDVSTASNPGAGTTSTGPTATLPASDYVYTAFGWRFDSTTGRQPATAGTGTTLIGTSATVLSGSSVQATAALAEVTASPLAAGTVGPYTATVPTAPGYINAFVVGLRSAAAAPLAATVSVTPNSGTAPLAVTATASTTGGTGTALTYAWAWGDGATTAAGSSNTATHTYNATGTYTVTLTAANS